MKKTTLYIAAGLLGAATFASCDNDFARPPMVLPPTVDVEATTTIEQLKDQYWPTMSTATTIGLNPETGDSVIFKGRVCSSDESGNIYKKIYVQSVDENGEQITIPFYVNASDIYEQYPFGQEVAVWATGLTIGSSYNVLTFGDPSDKDFYMTEDLFYAHIARTGLGVPEPSKVDTTETTIAELLAVKNDSEKLKVWQSRLVRVKDCSWVEAGQPYSNEQYGTNRYLTDESGNRLMVRNSTFTNYSTDLLPYGTGSVVGILSMYSGQFQLTMIDQEGCIGFDGETPPPGEVIEPAGEGTLESPYNAAKALELAKALKDGEELANVYVSGIVATVGEVSEQFGNATYTIADAEGSAVTFSIYRGYGLGGEKFTSANDIKAGDKVVVNGTLVNYKGNTPQMTQGSKIVSLNGQTAGGSEPSTGSLFSFLPESLTEMPADWTIENVTLGTAEYVWSWKVYNGKGYLNASAFVNNTPIPTEAYAISPVIDLSGATGCAMAFDHAAKFQTTLTQLCGVVAREEGAKEWTSLTIPVWPATGAWTFVNSGNVDLSAFDGKKIQVAFKYASNDAGADTWEIKNLAITGKK